MELGQFAATTWRWARLILLGAVVAGTAAFLIGRQIPPTYAASTTLLIHQPPASSNATGYVSIFVTESLPLTVTDLLRSQAVLHEVNANLGLGVGDETLAKNVSVSIVRDTQLVTVTAEDQDPQRAAKIANEIVRVFTRQNQEIQKSTFAGPKAYLQDQLAKAQEDLERAQANLAPATPADAARLQAVQARAQSNYEVALQNLQRAELSEAQASSILDVVQPAQPPLLPERPKPLLYALLAAAVGALLAGGFGFFLDSIDHTVKSRHDVERLLDVPLLSSVSRIPGPNPADKLVTITRGDSPIAETYRILAADIELAQTESPIRTILVTSSAPRDGRTTTAINLAVAAAQIGKRVILVDADVREPGIHELLRLGNTRGLTSLLRNLEKLSLDDYRIPNGFENLRVIPCGSLPSRPSALLGSPNMSRLIAKLCEHADLVLFDSPPLLGVVDTSLLAHVCDATLLVAHVGSTRWEDLTSARDRLLRCGSNLLGVVLNDSPASPKRNQHVNIPKMEAETVAAPRARPSHAAHKS